MNRLFKTKQ